MIDNTEFLRLAINNPKYVIARKRLIEQGTDFTIFSCNASIIENICNATDESLKKIAKFVEKANAEHKDIEVVMVEAELNASTGKALENFFSAFEDDNTPDRLFAVIGESGVGKTYMIEKRFPGIPEYACNSSLDPYSLCYYLADKDGTGLKPYETPFLNALKNGGKVYLDEFNELPRDTKMFIQGITDEKKFVVIGDEKVQIHKSFKIIASFNPPSETDEREPLGDAILSRAVGYVLELTDEIIMERLKVSQPWLRFVRKLFSFVRNSGMVDVRDLNFRDYQKFTKYNFEAQFQFKMCQGDVNNIREYKKIQSTGEYQKLLSMINNAAKGIEITDNDTATDKLPF